FALLRPKRARLDMRLAHHLFDDLVQFRRLAGLFPEIRHSTHATASRTNRRRSPGDSLRKRLQVGRMAYDEPAARAGAREKSLARLPRSSDLLEQGIDFGPQLAQHVLLAGRQLGERGGVSESGEVGVGLPVLQHLL